MLGAFIIINNTLVIVESEEISDQNVAATIFRTIITPIPDNITPKLKHTTERIAGSITITRMTL